MLTRAVDVTAKIFYIPSIGFISCFESQAPFECFDLSYTHKMKWSSGKPIWEENDSCFVSSSRKILSLAVAQTVFL